MSQRIARTRSRPRPRAPPAPRRPGERASAIAAAAPDRFPSQGHPRAVRAQVDASVCVCVVWRCAPQRANPLKVTWRTSKRIRFSNAFRKEAHKNRRVCAGHTAYTQRLRARAPPSPASARRGRVRAAARAAARARASRARARACYRPRAAGRRRRRRRRFSCCSRGRSAVVGRARGAATSTGGEGVPCILTHIRHSRRCWRAARRGRADGHEWRTRWAARGDVGTSNVPKMGKACGARRGAESSSCATTSCPAVCVSGGARVFLRMHRSGVSHRQRCWRALCHYFLHER